MTPRFNLFFRWFARRYFGHFELGEEAVERLRGLEHGGAVVYVMRYSSRLDYLLFNSLFLREGLRLSSFANGIHFYYYRPVLQLLARFMTRRRWRRRDVEHGEDRSYVRQLVRDGDSVFLFLRTARFRTYWRGLRGRRQRHDELDLLKEVVGEIWDTGRPLQLVPLSIFWRKGPRKENRFLNLDYGALTRPSDMAKVSSFLATYRELSVKVGEAIDLSGYIAEHREDGIDRVTRLARRSILVHLSREEKVVEGPTLRAPQRVMREVLADAGVRAAIQERAARSSAEGARREAEKMFREIAARMNSTLLAVLATAVGAMLRRMFSSIETVGLEKVAEYAKRHPLVLVPNHRSYFDFLIVSLLFYANYLVPPHIAARDNMAFGPFGLIFRMAGAFYLRRSFDDPLYKQVFRAYVAYLVREGFTQEFFIEGGRSRTGKTLSPRLGMLTWDVDAFLECHRRELFFVPIAITYERLVEESGMVEELEGGAKSRESTLALFRARKYLQRRFGSVHVSFGEPLSLADALGDRRERFQRLVRGEIESGGAREDEAADSIREEKRQFIDVLAHRIVERINWAVVANATSVAAAVLLGSSHRGLLRGQLVARMQSLVDLLQLQDVRLTAALEADKGDFSESIAFLLRSDLIRSARDPRGEILYFDESRRRALDLYRNSVVHYLAAPSILARRLLRGGSHKELREELSAWQEILYQEFFVPRGEVLAAHCEGFLDRFERVGWIEQRRDELLVATPAGQPFLRCLAAQTQGVIECYEVAFRTLMHADGHISRKAYLSEVAVHFANARLLGLVERTEAAGETTFGNVLELLVRRGVIEAHKVVRKNGSPQVVYSRGENWYALRELRERLAAALSAG